MINVVITTKNGEQNVVQCVQSVLDQELNEPFEVILLDDSSEDQTVAVAEKTFGSRIRIVANLQTKGWFGLLIKALDITKDNPLVIFDTHCVAGKGWLQGMVSTLDGKQGFSIVTGPSEHGEKFMQKLTAFTMHPTFLSDVRQRIDYIFDDNFAIYPDILRELLEELPIGKNLNDGIASTLLSFKIKSKGLHVLYEPSTRVFHISPKFLGYLREWYEFMAEGSIQLRRLDPGIRGSKYLRLGILAPFIYTSARFAQDIKNLFKFQKTLHIRLFEIPLFFTSAAVGKVFYLIGMIKVVLN